MKGIQGDAILIVIGILVFAAVTAPLWYPWVVRLFLRKKSELDMARERVVEYERQRDEAVKERYKRSLRRKSFK